MSDVQLLISRFPLSLNYQHSTFFVPLSSHVTCHSSLLLHPCHPCNPRLLVLISAFQFSMFQRLPLVTGHMPATPKYNEGGSLVTFLEVRKSPVHGRGVFAARAIRKGARIIEYTGRRVLWSSIPDDQDDTETYYFGLDNDKEVIDPSVGGNEARWINHSCDPNCETIEDRRGRVFIEAIRSIRT